MAYATAGLRLMREGVVNEFLLDTVDAVSSAVGSGYITDGTSSSTNGTPGKGMRMGDVVLVRVVGALAWPPASVTDAAWCFVSTANTSTGAVTITQIDPDT